MYAMVAGIHACRGGRGFNRGGEKTENKIDLYDEEADILAIARRRYEE